MDEIEVSSKEVKWNGDLAKEQKNSQQKTNYL